MITIKIKSIDWNDTNVNAYTFDDIDDLRNFCINQNNRSGPMRRLLVSIDIDGLNEQEFIACSRMLGDACRNRIMQALGEHYLFRHIRR